MDKLVIKSNAVFYIEITRFEDLLSLVGGVNVLLLCIDLLQNLHASKQESEEVLCGIISILELLIESPYQEDMLRFLQNNGAYVLAYLIKQVSCI